MISVVVAALNEERLLPACIESLNAQDWGGEYEVVVVDNGSTDRTAAVARAHGARVIVWPQRGVVYARQAGADAARGEIIVQADADTVYPPDWLRRIAAHFAAHPDSVAVGGRYVYLSRPRWMPLQVFGRGVANGFGMLFFRHPAWVSGANFAFRRSAFVQAQGYDPESLYPDQWGIARRLSRFGRVRYDAKLVVSTSLRRASKPIWMLTADFARNMAGVARHFVAYCVGLVRPPEPASQRRRESERWSLW